MGFYVGDIPSKPGPRTWGTLRTNIVNGNLGGGNFIVGFHYIEFTQGFKTTEGNGYVRTDYSPLYLGTVTTSPNFTASPLTSSPPKSEFASLYNTSSSGCLVAEDRAQLIGETVVLTSGSRTITSDAFVGPLYQVYSAYNAGEAITSIGKLTAF